MKEKQEMEGSQVNVVSWVAGSVLFSSWNAVVLERANVYFCFSVVNKFDFNYFLSFSFYDSQVIFRTLLPFILEPSLHFLHSDF